MTDLEMFAKDAIYEVFAGTVKIGDPVSFETAYKYIVEGEPGIVSSNSTMKSSSVFKAYCKRYWNVELEKYVNWIIKETAYTRAENNLWPYEKSTYNNC